MVGEERALGLAARFGLEPLVVVVFVGLPGTPLHRAAPALRLERRFDSDRSLKSRIKM
jgi:hypothetical protein